SEPFCYADGYQLARDKNVWKWRSLPKHPRPVCSSGIAAVGARIFIMGGADYDKERFYTSADRKGGNPRLGARLIELDTRNLEAGWQELPACPGTPRFVHAMAATHGGLFVIGGATGNDNSTGSYCTVVDNWR